MMFSKLTELTRRHATMERTSTVRGYSTNNDQLEFWSRLLDADAILLEAVRTRLAVWAKQGEGEVEKIVGTTIGAMMAFGVEPERATMAVQFVLHGAQGPVNP